MYTIDEPPRLSEHHLADLLSSGLTSEQAHQTGHQSVNADTAKEAVGHPLPGLLFNYLDPDGKPYRCKTGKWKSRNFARLKPDWKRIEDPIIQQYRQKYGNLPKYLSPGFVGNRPYFSRLQPNWPEICKRASISIDITEGEKKADSSCAHGFPTIGLSGVTCHVDHSPRDEWISEMGSQWDVDSSDAAPQVSRFLPELEQLDRDTNSGVLDWRNRAVGICFDSDIIHKVSVQVALEQLCAHLRARDSRPFPIFLPNETDGSKNGLDDFLKRHGAVAYSALRQAFLQLQNSPQQLVQFKSKELRGTPVQDGGKKEEKGEMCIFTLKEPNTHIKSLMAWAVLKEDWAYRPSLGWYRWNGRYWQPVGDPAEFEQSLTQFIDAQGWLVRSSNMIGYMARDIRNRVLVAEERWGNEQRLGFKNGVLDLETNQFSPHHREDYLTSVLPYDYNPAASCPTWLNFLEEATGGDRHLINLLQSWCKWIVTPKSKAGKSPIEKSLDLIGRKGTGKSTFLDVLYQLVGEGNYGDATPETFSTPVGLGQLLDRKLAVDADASGYLSHVGCFNKVVSNEPVTVKKLFKDTATLRLGVVVVRAYNDYPSVPSSGSEGLDRRLCIVPFRYPPKNPDIHLAEKLAAEMPGIFTWCWQLSRAEMISRILWSGSIAAVQQASIERFEADHPEFRFLRDEFPGGHESIQAFDLFERYVNWCKQNNHRPVSNTNFGRQMNELGINHWKGNGGSIFYEVPKMADFDLIKYLRIQPSEGWSTEQGQNTPTLPASNLEPVCVSEGSEGLVSENEPPNLEPVCVSEGSEGFGADRITRSRPIKKCPPKGPVQVGDLVMVAGKASLFRQGSDRLPPDDWQQLPTKFKKTPTVPMGLLSTSLFHEIQTPSRVLSISPDGQRVKIQNPETMRISVFATTDLQVLQRGGDE